MHYLYLFPWLYAGAGLLTIALVLVEAHLDGSGARNLVRTIDESDGHPLLDEKAARSRFYFLLTLLLIMLAWPFIMNGKIR